MSSKQKLWIVSEVFYPEEVATSYIMTKIANTLVDKYDVNVIAGPIAYEQDNNANSTSNSMELDGRISLERVGKAYNKNTIVQRAIGLIALSFKLAFRLYKNSAKNDKVLIVTNPAPLLLFIKSITWFKKLHVTVLVHDVFPENIFAAGVLKNENGFVYSLIKKTFDSVYAGFDSLIVLGRDMEEVVKNKIYKKKNTPIIHIIENWSDTVNVFPTERICDGKLIIQYAGNIGRVQGIASFIDCIRICSDTVEFHIYGRGALEEELKKYVKENQIFNVKFFGSFARKEQNDILSICDISLITLADNMYGLGVPSKSYNILAAGKPILYIGNENSEIALIVKEYDLGYVFDSKDKKGLTAFLECLTLNDIDYLKEKGCNARRVAEQIYREDIILDKYKEII